MRRSFHRFKKHASGPRVAGFIHISDAVADFFDVLLGEVEDNVDETGGFSGPVRPPQRPWSQALDQLEAERDADAL